jgi:hypothetical protein
MAERMPDLSKRAVDWAVLSASLQHPAVVYPAAAGVLGGIGAALLTASPVLVTGAVVGGGVALLSLGVNCLFRRDYFASRYLESAHRTVVAYRESVLEELVRDLREQKAAEALAQLERFGEKIKAFEDVLDDKLARNEITFGRFMGIAEQVYLSGIDNLRQVASTRKGSARAADEAYIRRRIATLESANPRSEAQATELAGLKQQLEVRKQNFAKVESCLAQNEQALAQLDLALAAVADMKTGSSHSSVTMETAMSDLQQIARRAGAYSTPQG